MENRRVDGMNLGED